MYIDLINIVNIGPIDKCNINAKFDEKGNPYPIILIGDNGKGKTIVSSYIADAIIELAKSKATYNNIVENDGALYRIVSNINIKKGKKYGAAIISFKDSNNRFSYVEKSGNVNIEDLHNDLISTSNLKEIENKLKSEDFVKEIVGITNRKEVEKYFNENVLCFFPSYRSEKPNWMNELAIKYTEIYNHERINGKLNKEIIVDHSEERNNQWISSVIVDSLIDIVRITDNNYFINGNPSDQQLLKKAKENLETILNYILKSDQARLIKEYRNSINNYKIVYNYKNSNDINEIKDLKQMSLGQAVLFNMFATIIRHADINDIMKSINISDIKGIVIIDEVDMHLDSEMQYEVLPKLIKLFPKIQFIITTHSPLFLLGMDKEFDDKYMLLEMPNAIETSTERFSEFENSYKYLNDTKKHEEEINELLNEKIKYLRSSDSEKPLIITEGPTDWRHIKYALSYFKQNENKYLDLDIEFLEYDDDFGESELIKMKDSLIRLPNTRKCILIADNDTSTKGIKEFNDGTNYKNWGNNVYSFRIPVPDFRKDTPNISIEHYYKDYDLKTEFKCEDNIKRRIYLGNDFNKKGLNIDKEIRCDCLNKCGKDKISVLSGSGNEKVYKITDENSNTTNYALSKKDFVEKIVTDSTKKIDFSNFSLIFDLISKIINE